MPLLDRDLQLTQLSQIGRRHSNGRQLGRHALDAAQRLKQIDDLADRQPSDMRSAPGNEFDKSFGRENF